MSESIQHIDVEVRPSIGFQTVGYTARVVFDTPISALEAISRAGEVRDLLTEQAHADIDKLVQHRQSSEVEQRAQAPAPVAGGSDGWAVANKPAGKGSFRYRTTSAVSSDEFRQAIVAQLPDLGISADDVDVFDDRVGNYGLESGNESYTAGKIKAKDGTRLHAALAGKSIVGGADFGPDGSVKVSLSRDGKAALQALQIAANLTQI